MRWAPRTLQNISVLSHCVRRDCNPPFSTYCRLNVVKSVLKYCVSGTAYTEMMARLHIIIFLGTLTSGNAPYSSTSSSLYQGNQNNSEPFFGSPLFYLQSSLRLGILRKNIATRKSCQACWDYVFYAFLDFLDPWERLCLEVLVKCWPSKD